MFKKLFGNKPPPTETPAGPREPTAAELLENAVAGLSAQDRQLQARADEQKRLKAEEERQTQQDFRRLAEAVILPVFNETISLFERHGSRAHIGKSEGDWDGDSVRLNLYGKADLKGPFIRFSLPEKGQRMVKVTRTLIESKIVSIPLDALDADRVKREIAVFIGQVQQHRSK